MWSVSLPAKWVQAGNTLTFQQVNKTGFLSDMKVGATSRILLHTIDMGFLVEPRGEFVLASDAAMQREYFQTVPASTMIVNQYESLHLTEVMMPNGTLTILTKEQWV